MTLQQGRGRREAVRHRCVSVFPVFVAHSLRRVLKLVPMSHQVQSVGTNQPSVPVQRPQNYARSLFHMLGALAGVLTIEWVAKPGWMIAAAAAWAAL